MMIVQGEGAFVIQNRTAKIVCAKIRVSQVVKQICVPLTCANERLETGNRFSEIPLCVLLVRICKLRIRLREDGCSREKRKHRPNKTSPGGSRPPGAMIKVWRLRRSIFIELGELDPTCASFHLKFSISPSTSRLFSGEILPGPLCVRLYCHSSFCSNKRRSRSRESVSSLKVSAAVSASTAFGSIPRLPAASAAFTRTTREASA